MQKTRNSSQPRLRRARRETIFWLCLTLTSLLPIVVAAPSTGADRLTAFLDGLTTLRANFTQITLSADGGRLAKSQGVLYVNRPGEFRWEYRIPDNWIIIGDGEDIWVHDVDLEQVSHSSQAKALNGTLAQLLITDSAVDRHFEVASWDGGDERTWVELRPKFGESDIVKIRIGFIDERLDTLVMEDNAGQLARFILTEIERNLGLEDDLFRLDPAVRGYSDGTSLILFSGEAAD